ANGSSVTGTIDGGTGTSTLNWLASLTARNVALTGLGASHGFAGTEASIGDGFTNIDKLLGGASLDSALTGLNTGATWVLQTNGINGYISAPGPQRQTLYFAGFERLTGGQTRDFFAIAGTQPMSLSGGGGATHFLSANGARVTGTIDGGTGASTLNWL